MMATASASMRPFAISSKVAKCEQCRARIFMRYGFIGTIADEVDTEFTFRVFNSGVGFTPGHMEAFGEQLEMVNQLHGLHGSCEGGATLWLDVITGPGLALSHLTHCRMIPFGLIHFFHANQIAVVVIPGFTYWDNIKVQLTIHVWLLFAQIPSQCQNHATSGLSCPSSMHAFGGTTPIADSLLLPNPVVGRNVWYSSNRENAV